MLTHIVWWTLKPEAAGKSAAENAAAIRQALLDLRGRIPELRDLTVSTRILDSSTENSELVLVTRHDDAEGLKAYAVHPDHLKVGAMLKEAAASRKAIDFTD